MKWFFLIILFIAALLFGVEIVKDPGYAFFVYHGWSVQMPLWFALLLLLLLLFFMHIVTRLFYAVVFLKYSIKFWWMKRALDQKEMQNQKK
jgi:uncharacterized protein HemY